ncbi:MAG TPA: hypothetical protein VNE18_10620 [Rhodanobacter sp.]|nr:hypothetical protein [Rhodanobacter sp.]
MSVHAACIAATLAALPFAAPAWGQRANWESTYSAMRPEILPGAQELLPMGNEAVQQSCVVAAAAAERRYPLPHGLLLAIGEVETGRPDPRTGRRAPWPWSVNAGTDGRYFTSKAQAVAWVHKAQASGAVSIDVGCMQVNLQAHPHAFTSLNEAFDPASNADYAALFLIRLHAETGDWGLATAEYHSRTPALGVPYRKEVALAAATVAKQPPRTRLQMLRDAWAATLPHGAQTGDAMAGMTTLAPANRRTDAGR